MGEPKPTRILLVDDHTLFRESLRRLLESETNYSVVAEVASVPQAVQVCESDTPFDLALIDYHLGLTAGEQGGLSVLRHLREIRPEVPALMITAGIEPKELTAIVRDLHAGVFLKADPAAELLLALQKTLRGEIWLSSGVGLALFSSSFAEQPALQDDAIAFEPREREVLSLVVEGLSNKEISSQLKLSESSVKAVLQKLFQKVGVRTRAQLVRFAFESDLNLG